MTGGRWPRRLAGLVALAVLALWIAWMGLWQVSVFVSSDSAWLEAEAEAHSIQARKSGRLTRLVLRLGERVSAGDLLAEIDCSSEKLSLRERQGLVQAHREEGERIQAQVESVSRALTILDKRGLIAAREATSRLAQAEVERTLASQQSEREQKLSAEGITSAAESERATAEAARSGKEVETLRLGINRVRAQTDLDAATLDLQLATLARERTQNAGLVASQQALVERMEYELEKCKIRAPIDGVIGSLSQHRIGTMLDGNEELGTVIPNGEVRVVASFGATSLGRLRSGQRARLRLDSFPWLEHGSLAVEVVRVASELRGGRLRIELRIPAESLKGWDLSHGLTGQVDVVVEEVSPMTLLLRSAGGIGATRKGEKTD